MNKKQFFGLIIIIASATYLILDISNAFAASSSLDNSPTSIHPSSSNFTCNRYVSNGSVTCTISFSNNILLSRPTGSSMYPVFSDGDYVFLDNNITPQTGDFAAYEKNGTWVMHQLVRIESNKYIFKGTNNRYEDEPVEATQIRGVAVGVLKNIDYKVD